MSNINNEDYTGFFCPQCCRAGGTDKANLELHELVGIMRSKFDSLYESYLALLMKYEDLKHILEPKHGNLLKINGPVQYYMPQLESASLMEEKDREILMLKHEIFNNEMKIRSLHAKVASEKGKENENCFQFDQMSPK